MHPGPRPFPAAAAGLLVGALATDLLIGLGPHGPPPAPPVGVLRALPSPRRLLRAEGVGAVRATAIARVLWWDGLDADLEQIPGVGPATAARARGAIEPIGDEDVHSSALLLPHDRPRTAARHR